MDYIELRLKNANFDEWVEKLARRVAKTGLDFSKMDIPSALQHVKFRDFSLKLREISGCHDAVEFAKLRSVKSIGNPNYKVAAGKALDEVEEIIIFVEETHTNVPGVKVIEYKIPASDGKFTQRINGVDVNKGYTTGNLIGDGPDNYVKTIYDPKIWTDAKLEKALKEALQDVVNKNKGVIPREWEGLSNEGYPIHGYFDNGKVTSFFFK